MPKGTNTYNGNIWAYNSGQAPQKYKYFLDAFFDIFHASLKFTYCITDLMLQMIHYTDSDITFPYIYSYALAITKYVSNRSCE
jgi:hypothetical protein